jgi:hypothetical protein
MAFKPQSSKGKYCSPLGEQEARNSGGSCYTKQQLVTIATAFNRKYSDKQPILLSGSKDELWNQIDQRMNECTTEMCWLDKLNLESRIANQYGSSPFRPAGPAGKNQWLSTLNIRDVLKQYEDVYPDFIALGPVPIDFCRLAYNEVCHINLKQVLAKGKRRIGIVFNTDPSDKPGKHWVSMFIDLTGNPDKWEVNYFDSYGKARVAPEIRDLIKHLKTQNPSIIVRMNCSDDFCTAMVNHQKLNTECGVYSINFIVERLHGRSWKDMVTDNLYDDATIARKRRVFFREV